MRAFVLLATVGAILCGASICTAAEPIAAFQNFLNERGCNVGAADGAWGKQTTAGAKIFATQSGVEIVRPIDEALLERLRATEAVCPPLMSLARFVPADVLQAASAVPAAEAARICQGDLGARMALLALTPQARLSGNSSQMYDTADVNRTLDQFVSQVNTLVSAAYVANDPLQKELAIRLLAKWAKARAYVETADCSDLSCKEWTSDRGREASSAKDYQTVQEALIGVAFGYYATLHNFEPVKLAEEHAVIGKWFDVFFGRMPRNAKPVNDRIFFGFGLKWQTWGQPMIDLLRGREDQFAGRLANIKKRLGGLVREDGSLVERTDRGARAFWYHRTGAQELFYALEMLRANGIDVYPQFAERLDKVAEIFLDATDDIAGGRNTKDAPARIYKWAKADFHSADDPRIQLDNNDSFDEWGSWVYVYLYRMPDAPNAERMRQFVQRQKRLPQTDRASGFNTGCLYRMAIPELRDRELTEGSLVDASFTRSLIADINSGEQRARAVEATVGTVKQTDEWDSGAGYIVQLRRLTVDGERLPPMTLDLLTDFTTPDRKEASINLIRVAMDNYILKDEKSRTADYSRCGDIAGDRTKFRIHFGPGESADANRCVLSLMGPTDAAYWSAVVEGVPAALHDAAKDATSEDLLRLDRLMQMRIAE